MEDAKKLADTMKDKFISPEHILLAITKDSALNYNNPNQGKLNKLFMKFSVNEVSILNAIKKIRGNKTE